MNIGIVVDSFGKSRNAFYALHAREDAATLSWVLQCHITNAGVSPDTIGSDRDTALIRSISETCPLSFHFYCLHHTQGNIVKHARTKLSNQFSSFIQDFWATYRAVSPDEFERLWGELTLRYPAIQDYLNEELYPCRERWAWAWISTRFTAGIRTTGRVKSENHISKSQVGAKTSAKQLFDFLNQRTKEQSSQDL